ncbi:MAG: glycosyltransferase family 2 protein [Burkholderiales bacterium]|nr:glycosyltransferase family 2 protein [Burkholderiales bacterium]
MTVDILLATYNGAKFLSGQLASIAAQTHGDWRLIARDDGSSDGTVEILKDFAGRYPERVRLLANDRDGPGGASANFGAMLDEVDADYVLFADQDDEWLPNKIAVLWAEMRRIEAAHAGCPVLVHSDLVVTDSVLRTDASSFWSHMGLDPRAGASFKRLMLENCVTGCASMINRQLIERARPIPAEAIMHDWWLALVASAFGVIGVVDTPTVRYRQHANNAVGARAASLPALMGSGIRQGWLTIRVSLACKRAQASSFLARYRDVLDPVQRETAEAFIALPQLPFGLRQWRALNAGLRMSTTARSIGLYLSM